MTRGPAYKERAKPAHPYPDWIPDHFCPGRRLRLLCASCFLSLSGLTALHASCFLSLSGLTALHASCFLSLSGLTARHASCASMSGRGEDVRMSGGEGAENGRQNELGMNYKALGKSARIAPGASERPSYCGITANTYPGPGSGQARPGTLWFRPRKAESRSRSSSCPPCVGEVRPAYTTRSRVAL